MSEKQYRVFRYAEKEGYDSSCRVNGEKLPTYSKKKLNELHPAKDYVLCGETFERKKRNKEKDIGSIELADRKLYVSKPGTNSRIFRKQENYVAVDGGGYIVLLRLRLLPFILVGILLLGLVCGVACAGLPGGFIGNTERTESIDPNIQPVETDIITISGKVTKAGTGVEGVTLSLQSRNEEIGAATTDPDGNYLISDVQNGVYNLVCTCGNSVLTKIAVVYNQSITVDFRFPADDLHDVSDITGVTDEALLPPISTGSNDSESAPVPGNKSWEKDDEMTSDVKAVVAVTSDDTPPIAVGGLDTEAMLHMVAGKEVDVTFFADKLEDSRVPAEAKSAIEAICGELKLTYYDFSIQKEIYTNGQKESSEYLTNSKMVLEIAVPYDSSTAIGTYAFRYHGGAALRMTELTARPTENMQDGTYFVTADTVFLYSNCFSTYAIGSADAGKVTRGTDVITYSDNATLNLATGKISMKYEHNANSTHSAKVELYLVGTNGDLLIAESGTVPPGTSLTEMTLLSNINNMPSVGTYNGLMKICYLDTEGNTATNVDIPLSVAITQ